MKKRKVAVTISVVVAVGLLAGLMLGVLPGTVDVVHAQPLSPSNGAIGAPVSGACFSWSPFKETTKYKFVLAKDAAMTLVVKEATVTTTAYCYDGVLDYSTNYFWRIMALEPAPSDWSATFSFLTEAAPVPPPPPTPVWVDLIFQHLEYSPNGQEIAFVRNDGNNPEICILDVRTRKIRQITNNQADDCNPTWSPNGSSIAFLSDRDGSWQIYEMNLRTGKVTKLTNFK
jgi:WD40 repeat protein